MMFQRKPKTLEFSFNDTVIQSGKDSFTFRNVILAGNQCGGRDAALLNIMYDAINHNVPVVFIQNGTAVPGNTVGNELVRWYGSPIFTYNLCEERYSGGIDLFKDASDAEKIEMLITLMNHISKPNQDVIQYAKLYFAYLLEIISLMEPGSCLPLNPKNLKLYSTQWMGFKIKGLERKGKITPSKAATLRNFVDTYVPMHLGQAMEVDTFVTMLNNYDFAESISSGDSLIEKLRGKIPMNFYLEYSFKSEYSEALVEILVKQLTKQIPRSPDFKILTVTEEIEVPRNKVFSNLMMACQAKPKCNLVFTTNDILEEQDGEGTWNPVSYTNTFFIFKQNNPETREYWAKMSGTYKKKEVTQNLSTNRAAGNVQRGTLTDMIWGNKEVKTGSTISEVDEYRITENDLLALPDTKCIVLITGKGSEPYILPLDF